MMSSCNKRLMDDVFKASGYDLVSLLFNSYKKHLRILEYPGTRLQGI